MNDRLLENGKFQKELVLFYTPENKEHTPLLRGVLSQMHIKIKNLTAERCVQKIGYLAGLEGFEKREVSPGYERYAPAMEEELLVFCGLTDERLEELLANLKKAGVPQIPLKAVVTDTNAEWTVYRLYDQLREEHAQLRR